MAHMGTSQSGGTSEILTDGQGFFGFAPMECVGGALEKLSYCGSLGSVWSRGNNFGNERLLERTATFRVLWLGFPAYVTFTE